MWDENLRGPQMASPKGRTIFKYQMPVLEHFSLKLPSGAQILRVDHIDGLSWLWAVVDTNAPLETRYFRAYKTGAEMRKDLDLQYLGFCPIFVQMELGLYIFEVI
jgi:hypothetical protein